MPLALHRARVLSQLAETRSIAAGAKDQGMDRPGMSSQGAKVLPVRLPQGDGAVVIAQGGGRHRSRFWSITARSAGTFAQGELVEVLPSHVQAKD